MRTHVRGMWLFVNAPENLLCEVWVLSRHFPLVLPVLLTQINKGEKHFIKIRFCMMPSGEFSTCISWYPKEVRLVKVEKYLLVQS